MTNEEPKIIDRTKELRQRWKDYHEFRGEELHKTDCGEVPCSILHNFPAIAEALILAYEALEAASEYVCDPDELPPMMMTSEYRPPITQEERLLDEIERVKRKKAVAKQVKDALSSLNA